MQPQEVPRQPCKQTWIHSFESRFPLSGDLEQAPLGLSFLFRTLRSIIPACRGPDETFEERRGDSSRHAAHASSVCKPSLSLLQRGAGGGPAAGTLGATSSPGREASRGKSSLGLI